MQGFFFLGSLSESGSKSNRTTNSRDSSRPSSIVPITWHGYRYRPRSSTPIWGGRGHCEWKKSLRPSSTVLNTGWADEARAFRLSLCGRGDCVRSCSSAISSTARPFGPMSRRSSRPASSTCWPVGWAVLEDRHVRIDLFYHRFSVRKRAAVDCLPIPFLLSISSLCSGRASTTPGNPSGSGKTTMSPWNPPFYPMKILLTLGLFLIFLQGTARLIRNIDLLRNKKAPMSIQLLSILIVAIDACPDAARPSPGLVDRRRRRRPWSSIASSLRS